MNRLLFILTVLLCGFASGQKLAPKAPAQVAPPPVVTDTVSYPLPVEEHAKARDFQLQWDELEIDNQKMLLKIEQNKAQQATDMDEIRRIFFQFAELRQIDLHGFEPDAKDLKFVAKKKVK